MAKKLQPKCYSTMLTPEDYAAMATLPLIVAALHAIREWPHSNQTAMILRELKDRDDKALLEDML